MIYGNSGTIHRTDHLHVEVGPDGRVCAVWFRCMMLPFEEVRVDDARATEMYAAQERVPRLNAVDVTLSDGTPP